MCVCVCVCVCARVHITWSSRRTRRGRPRPAQGRQPPERRILADIGQLPTPCWLPRHPRCGIQLYSSCLPSASSESHTEDLQAKLARTHGPWRYKQSVYRGEAGRLSPESPPEKLLEPLRRLHGAQTLLLCFTCPGHSGVLEILGHLPRGSEVMQSTRDVRVTISASCMLSRFSCVQLFVTLWTADHQAPLSMGFSRQEDWRGQLQLPSGQHQSLLQGIFLTQGWNPCLL